MPPHASSVRGPRLRLSWVAGAVLSLLCITGWRNLFTASAPPKKPRIPSDEISKPTLDEIAKPTLDQQNLDTKKNPPTLAVSGASVTPDATTSLTDLREQLKTKPRIAMLVFADEGAQRNMETNLVSLQCLAKVRGYRLKTLAASPSCMRKFSKHIFYQRWCTYLEEIEASTDTDWFLTLDGDVAVVNFNHAIESYIEHDRDIIHVLREHNNEVMAGYVLIRNSPFGRAYLRDWISLNPDNRGITHGFSGANADNGALHWLLLDRLGNSSFKGWDECRKVGGHPGRYTQFVTCFHDVLKQGHCTGGAWNNIRILPRATFVAYDGWVTYYKWSDSTFMHHAMKNPPISSQTCCKRPLVGRVMPRVTCDATVLSRKDEWYIPQSELDELFTETYRTEHAKHNPTSYDDTSCVQNGQRIRKK